MSPATWPRERSEDAKMLRIDPRARSFRDERVGDLPADLRGGDLLVVNDAATYPGSLRAGSLEIRLAGEREGGTFAAVLFGEGDWRTPTEARPKPPALAPGARLSFGGSLTATVERVSALSTRLVELRFDREGAALWSALYAEGRPIQYAYLEAPLELWHVQTAYAARPWAAELPSAGRPLGAELLGRLARAGVRVAAVTHAAGLSSTGDPAIDAALPLPERFDVSARAIAAIASARAAGGRVIAVGTSVVRALEGCAALHGGELAAGEGVTDLVVRRGFEPLIVQGLFTGIHEPSASHFELLQAFAPLELVKEAYAHAEGAGYLGHEFGDASLVLAA